MGAAPPQISALSRNWGAPNSTVRVSIHGAGLDGVTAIRFLGFGVVASSVAAASADRLLVDVSIAAYAPLGPRPLLLVLATGALNATDAIFYVGAPFGSMSVQGIGGHLL